MTRLLTEERMRERFKAAVQGAGSLNAWCIKAGVDYAAAYRAFTGQGGLPPIVLKALGYQKVNRYAPTDKSG